MSTMGTFSGRRFDPLMMTPEDVVLEDSAHALSLLCRGGGQLKYFYSVGQHCINCMKEAKREAGPQGCSLPAFFMTPARRTFQIS